jgi:hypothetical protein
LSSNVKELVRRELKAQLDIFFKNDARVMAQEFLSSQAQPGVSGSEVKASSSGSKDSDQRLQIPCSEFIDTLGYCQASIFEA